MRPILYSKNETTFTTNGIGRLNPSYCIVEEERNGSYEAELKISKDDKYYKDIELGSKIKLLVSDGTFQIFKVYSIEKQLDSEIEIKCQHISYDLSFIPVRLYSANSASEALQKITTNSMVTNPFSFGTDIVSSITFEPKVPASAKSYLASILELYSGEYKFNNMNVYLYQERGIDSGVTVRYGKNITDVEDEITNEDTIDGLIPYWTDGSITVIGDILRVNTGDRIITEDVSSDISLGEGEERPTLAQVNQAGSSVLLTKVTGSEETIKVSYYQNPDIVNVHLCDYVTVIYEPYNISAKIKVVRTKWNVLKEKYESVELGEIKSFEKTMTGITQTINSLNYSNGITQIRLERTEDGIEAEVTRATSAEESLSGQIDIKAGEVVQQVSATVKTWDTSSYNISVYGIGSPYTQGVEADEHYHEYYLDNASGELWYSNGSYWYHVAYLTSVISEVRGELALKIDEDDYGTVISLIEGYADYIKFNANKLFTINSENLIIDDTGLIKANNIDLNGTTSFHTLTKYYDSSTGDWTWSETPIGYMGLTNVGDDTGIGMRNYAGTGAVIMGPTTGNLWLKGASEVICFGAYGFFPWNSSIQLGQDSRRWTTLYCNNISCSNPPWSTSDKRLKNVKGDLEKAEEFYMELKPVEFTFKEGVAFENPENMHYGLIAQDVLKTYEKCYNTSKQSIVKKEKVLEDSTKEVLEGDEEKYSINYDELHAFHITMIQNLVKKIDTLEAKIQELEGKTK